MQMAFKNLYELLGVKPTATDEEILNAMRRLAQLQLVELDDLKLCKSVLLNPEERKKYNAKLFAEYPELLETLSKPQETQVINAKPKTNLRRRYIILLGVSAVVGVIISIAYFTHYKPLWEAENAVKDKLKDPESARFYDVKKIKNNNTTAYCGKVNAKVPAGGYGGKKRFVYFVEKNEAFIIPNERPDDEEEEITYSVMWKGGCKKNNLDFMIGKSEHWAKARKGLKEAEHKRNMLKRSEGTEEYMEANREYEDFRDQALQLRDEITIYN